MSDGDYLASYDEVRNTSKGIDSDNVPDSVLDQNIKNAQQEVEDLLKTQFDETTQPSFSQTLFNTRDLNVGTRGAILYFTEFQDYNFIQTITTVDYRSSEGSSFDTLTEGQNGDYVVDLNIGLKFDSGLARDGNQNLRVSGTYGYLYDDAPSKFKIFIQLVAALRSIVYASGGSYESVDSHTIGNVSVSQGQYAANLKQEYTNVVRLLEGHLKMTGLRMERSSISIV